MVVTGLHLKVANFIDQVPFLCQSYIEVGNISILVLCRVYENPYCTRVWCVMGRKKKRGVSHHAIVVRYCTSLRTHHSTRHAWRGNAGYQWMSYTPFCLVFNLNFWKISSPVVNLMPLAKSVEVLRHSLPLASVIRITQEILRLQMLRSEVNDSSL